MKIEEHGSVMAIWLTKEEQENPELQEELQKLYADCKERKIMPVVYQSGDADLKNSTLDLLIHNKRRKAELLAQARKTELDMGGR